MKKGVLLINLGTPDDPGRRSVYRYLKQFLLDPRVIDFSWLKRNLLVRLLILPFRSSSSSKLYKMLWTEKGSPLKYYGEQLTAGVQAKLGDGYSVKLAMRYQSPSIQSAVDELLDENVSEITVLPLFPQYASASTGSVIEELMRTLSQEEAIPPMRIINSFYDNQSMIRVFAKKAREYDMSQYDHFIFSFHGLPERQLKNTGRNNRCKCDGNCCQVITNKNQFCYSAQCYATARAIQKELSIKDEDCTVSFQSRLGKDPWIQPYTDKVLEQLLEDGKKRVLVFSPAFVADCLETTIEIEHEYREDFFKDGGVQLDLVASLNDDPEWISEVAEMVE